MNIAFSSDRTGFPLVHLTELGYDVHLLPVTKSQFEQFASSDPIFRVIYEHARSLNPLPLGVPKRGSKEPVIAQRFMTGVLPEEALQFAVWLDNNEPTSDYALPNVAEWRAVYDCLQYERCEQYIDDILENSPGDDANQLIQSILKKQPQTLLELSMMRNGVIEWVHSESDWVGLGTPAPAFYPNTFEPLLECVEPVDATQRMRPFGFRLIRTF